MAPVDDVFVLLEHLLRSATTGGDARLIPFVLEVQNRHEVETWSFRPSRDDGRFFVPVDDGAGRGRIRIPAWALRELVVGKGASPVDVEGDLEPLAQLGAVIENVRNPLSVRFT